ncbi:hypothetical protein [Biostraticola tofi]|uniref:Uncharacterized protein n=1 Tax=Biostraticola tofi TaxID=466109 RepID=A0A4R3YYZ0_9GAMM|nr:hypothetical protein [Biostraticola tofi]TCV96744.1 hypothetical protein EDC52_104184 [Biostraticola tofi]
MNAATNTDPDYLSPITIGRYAEIMGSAKSLNFPPARNILEI